MLIYWPSMKRNALQALWLILHQAQWSGKDCDSDSGVDTTWRSPFLSYEFVINFIVSTILFDFYDIVIDP